jgi:parvulin-like peptidyl-prolyl isomerase
MPKRRRRTHVPALAWEREHHGIGARFLGRSTQFYATLCVVALVIVAVGLVGYGFGKQWLDDYNRPGSTAIQVDQTKYSVDYYAKRLNRFVSQIGGATQQLAQAPQLVLDSVSNDLIDEALLIRFAEEQGQTVTDDEVKAEIAKMLSTTVDAPDFATKFQDELNKTGITDAQYHDMAKASALRAKVQNKFNTEVPASAESVHYRQIAVADKAEADALKAQIEAGADFAQLAAAKSTDTSTKDKGGDVGWAPRGALEAQQEAALFALQPGQLTVYGSGGNFYVYQVVEREADWPVEESQKSLISSNAFQKWLEGKRASVTLVNDMDLAGGDQKKIEYALKRIQAST